jgi:hypothetical protein
MGSSCPLLNFDNWFLKQMYGLADALHHDLGSPKDDSNELGPDSAREQTSRETILGGHGDVKAENIWYFDGHGHSDGWQISNFGVGG